MHLKIYYPNCVFKILETESSWGVFNIRPEDENFYLIIPALYNPVLYDLHKFDKHMSKFLINLDVHYFKVYQVTKI